MSNIPGSYAILLFTALDFTSITSHIRNWVVLLLWLRLFFLSGVISPLISNNILGATNLGSSSFSVLYFCLFIIVHGVLKARILEWLDVHLRGDLPDSEIEPESLISPALAGRFFTTSTRAEKYWIHLLKMIEPGDGNV